MADQPNQDQTSEEATTNDAANAAPAAPAQATDHIAATIAMSVNTTPANDQVGSQIGDMKAAASIAAKVIVPDGINKLKDGRQFRMNVGNGKTVVQATREAGADAESMLIPCTIRLLLQVETSAGSGEYDLLFIEELLGLCIGDYMKVQASFAEINF